MYSAGWKYFKNINNIFDLITILSYATYASIKFTALSADDQIETVYSKAANISLTIAMFFGIFRGLRSGFKMHSSTRFVQEMLFQIMTKIFDFLIVYLGVVTFFGIM